MEDFFATIAARWPPGREDYHWHVLPPAGPGRDLLAAPYLRVLDQPGLVAVRPWCLHVTVQHLGPCAGVSDAELDAIVGLVRERCARIAPFTVTAGRAQAWQTSVIRPLRPADRLASLWRLTTTASGRVTEGRLGTRPAAFHPHLALAYAVGHVDHDTVRAGLSGSAASDTGFPVDRLVLAAQRHDGREITFRALLEIPLGGPDRSGGAG